MLNGKRTYTVIAIGALVNLAFAFLSAHPKTAAYKWLFSPELQAALTLFVLSTLGYLKSDDVEKIEKFFVKKSDVSKKELNKIAENAEEEKSEADSE